MTKAAAKEHKEMGTIMPARMIMFDEYYFPEALQNFADKLCEKQRENCYKKVHETLAYKSVLCAEQPQINEL